VTAVGGQAVEAPPAGCAGGEAAGDGSRGRWPEKMAQNMFLLPCYNRFTFLHFLLCEYAL
jgi:hypothetical protein